MGFDEWFIFQLGDRDENSPQLKIAKMWGCGAYNAGAQSRQQEVDKLRTEIDDLKNKVFGLQKMIDELSEINEIITDELVVYRSRFGKGETNE